MNQAPTGLCTGLAAYSASVKRASPAEASKAPTQSRLVGRRSSRRERISGQSAQMITAAAGILSQKIQVQPKDDAVIRPPHSGPRTLPISWRALTAPSTGLRSPAG